MSDLFDKVLMAGMGLENKVKKTVSKLAKEGNKEVEKGLNMKEDLENRFIENVVDVVGAGLKKVGVAKKEIDGVVATLAEDMTDRLRIVTFDDLDIVETLVMKNREKVTKLEKKVAKLEAIIKDLTKEKE